MVHQFIQDPAKLKTKWLEEKKIYSDICILDLLDKILIKLTLPQVFFYDVFRIS